MATKTTVTLTDDLDPEQSAEETVLFGLDGTSYEIDLSTEHAEQLRDRLATYVGNARKADSSVGGRRARRSTGTSSGSNASAAATALDSVDTKAVREWAKAHGKPVSERGRLASSLLVEFQQAQRD